MANFRILAQYMPEKSFNVDSYLKDADKRELATASIEWILKNKKMYIAENDALLNLFNGLAIVPDTAETDVYIDLLQTFYLEFLNNPYLFENRISEVSFKNKICSKHIVCYLVLYEDVYMPIGVLKKFVGKETFGEIITLFLKDRINNFKNLTGEDIKLCGEYYKKIGEGNKKNGFVYKVKCVLYSVIIILVAV